MNTKKYDATLRRVHEDMCCIAEGKRMVSEGHARLSLHLDQLEQARTEDEPTPEEETE